MEIEFVIKEQSPREEKLRPMPTVCVRIRPFSNPCVSDIFHRFCVGDRFYLCDNKILCEYDYEERMVFANMNVNQQSVPPIKRQANGLPLNNNNSTINNNNTTNNNNVSKGCFPPQTQMTAVKTA